MPAPSPLAIATSSVQRLVKEETYYHKELSGQQVRVDKLETQINERSADLDENAGYMLKQEVRQYFSSLPHRYIHICRNCIE